MLERPRTGSALPLARGAGVPTLEEAVASFWRHHSRRRAPLRSSVERLAELALAPDPRVAAEGTRVLFERIVEPLCDGFTQRGAETYRRLFAQVVDVARRNVHCAGLDEALTAAGLRSERDLLRAPSSKPLSAAERERVRVVVVLSRLTLGADVAISMPMLSHVEAAFPNAEIAFVGNDASEVIARSFSRVTHVKVPYGRSDFLADRLNAWPALLDAVRTIRSDSAKDEIVLIDPDSRLTQLGLLRPLEGDRYFHFPSRQYGVHATDPLGVLISRWLCETFEPVPDRDWCLRISAHEAAWARAIRGADTDSRPLVAIHFGVGGNEKKRAGIEFETELVEWLVDRARCRVLLARGASPDEVEETYRLCRRLAERRVAVAHLPAGCDLDGVEDANADVLTWEASVDAFIATIAHADVFIGYDSAGQHIAAALEVPAISLFVEASGRRHALRWTPCGRGLLEVVRSPWPPDRRALLERTQDAFASVARVIASPGHRKPTRIELRDP